MWRDLLEHPWSFAVLLRPKDLFVGLLWSIWYRLVFERCTAICPAILYRRRPKYSGRWPITVVPPRIYGHRY